jgi:hypothetical protein
MASHFSWDANYQPAGNARGPVRLKLAIDLQYEVCDPRCDFVFNFQCARTPQQNVLAEELLISQNVPSFEHTDPTSHARHLSMSAMSGGLHIAYRATLDLHHYVASPGSVDETPVAQIPNEVMAYIYPSRYCQSDRFGTMAIKLFGHLPHGYQRVSAIQDWVRQQVAFRQNTSTSMTSAIDTLIDQVGVCRDFAHLMIAMCRALSIPARFTTGIDYGADPALGPTDFHAYVEVYLGHRWFIFDPSGTAIPMGFIRIGTGRDAADVSFATIFGNVIPSAPLIDIAAVSVADNDWALPYRRVDALSTDAASLAP